MSRDALIASGSSATPLSGPTWSTSCLHDGAAAPPTEPGALDEHLRACLGGNRRLFVLRCGADTVHAFVIGRLVSSLAAVALLAALVAWLW
jgi:hypothetical protein